MPDMRTIKFPGSETVYNIADSVARRRIEEEKQRIDNTNKALEDFETDVDTTIENFNTQLGSKIDGAHVDEDGRLCLTVGGEIVAGPFEVAGGGGTGGGSSNNATLTFTNTTGWLAKTVSFGSDCVVTAT